MISGEKKMRACSTAGGGVMFIPDEIQRTTKAVSYRDLVKDEPVTAKKPAFTFSLFGRKKAAKPESKAA